MTKKAGKKVLRGQISIALVLFLLAGAAMWFYHTVFDREPGFSKNLTGILVMRIVGDDMFDSLQRELFIRGGTKDRRSRIALSTSKSRAKEMS
jgi:hypothetical protein